MPTLEYPKNPNTDTVFVVQDDGVTRNRALMTAPQDISTLELPNNPNSTKGYIIVNGKKQRVILTAEIAGGGGGGSVDYSRVVETIDNMPGADSSNEGKIYLYKGQSDGTFTHGYIYENQKITTYNSTVTFSPATLSGINVNCGGPEFANFVKEAIGGDPTVVASGTLTYDAGGNLWIFVGKDSSDNVVGTYQVYQEDYQDAGFTFSGTPTDGDVVDFTCTIVEDSVTYDWVLLNTQPLPTPEEIGAVTKKTEEQILKASDWVGNVQTISVDGVKDDNTVIISPNPNSATDYADAEILCTQQAFNTLTFTCVTTPTNDIFVNIVILN